MKDKTEQARRVMVAEINRDPGGPMELAEKHGVIYAMDKLRQSFEVIEFSAPFVSVRRRCDGVKGTLEFQHWPRYYYDFVPEGD